MYKKIILAILIAILSFGSVNANYSMSGIDGDKLSDYEKVIIKSRLKKYINRYELKNWNEKTLKLLKKVWIKLREINEKYNNKSWHKRELYRFIWWEIYNLYLSKQDNTEKIVKTFSPGVYITQNKYWLWYTKVYIYGKEIFSDRTLDEVICNYYWLYDCSFNIKNNYEISEDVVSKIKNKAIQSIKFHKEWIPEKVNFKLLSIFFYEWVNSYLLDVDNKKIITWWLQFIKNFKIWKSWYYFISDWYWKPELFFVNKNWYIKKLFWFSTDNSSLLDYELLTNKRVKLYLSKWDWEKTIKFEKIINIK